MGSKDITARQDILDAISDIVSDFVYYDRKDDDSLSSEELRTAVNRGEITIDEMVNEFRRHLENTFKKEK